MPLLTFHRIEPGKVQVTYPDVTTHTYGLRQKNSVTQFTDGTSGVGYSGYSNIGIKGSVLGMQRCRAWNRGDKTVIAHGQRYNLDQRSCQHPLDYLALAIDLGETTLPAVGETAVFRYPDWAVQ